MVPRLPRGAGVSRRLSVGQGRLGGATGFGRPLPPAVDQGCVRRAAARGGGQAAHHVDLPRLRGRHQVVTAPAHGRRHCRRWPAWAARLGGTHLHLRQTARGQEVGHRPEPGAVRRRAGGRERLRDARAAMAWYGRFLWLLAVGEGIGPLRPLQRPDEAHLPQPPEATRRVLLPLPRPLVGSVGATRDVGRASGGPRRVRPHALWQPPGHGRPPTTRAAQRPARPQAPRQRLAGRAPRHGLPPLHHGQPRARPLAGGWFGRGGV
mmetsp:Transcript_59344/g.142397  ORF Transcript_59344/g.142397 Transcript_59344/m.142397 type:complete len:264 (-) Transcript_59344:556-1347(-)